MLSLAAEQAPPRHQPVARAGDQLGVVRAEVEAGHLAGVLQRGQQVLLQPHPAIKACLIFRIVDQLSPFKMGQFTNFGGVELIGRDSLEMCRG